MVNIQSTNTSLFTGCQLLEHEDITSLGNNFTAISSLVLTSFTRLLFLTLPRGGGGGGGRKIMPKPHTSSEKGFIG